MGGLLRVRHLLGAVTVEPIAFLTMTAIYFLIQGQQQFYYFKLCVITYNETDICYNLSAYPELEDTIQKETSRWLLYTDLVGYIPAVFSMLILGAWSDRVGRKPPLIMACVGGTILGVVSLVSALWIHLPMPLMLLGWACFGLCGSQGIMMSTMLSYIADVTTVENRVVRMGVVEGVISFASVVGSVVPGLLTNRHQFLLMYLLFISLILLALLYTIFCLKKTRTFSHLDCGSKAEPHDIHKSTDDETQPLIESQDCECEEDSQSLDQASTCVKLCRPETLVASLVVCTRKRPGHRRLIFILLMTCFFLHFMAFYGFNDIFVLYTTKAPIRWSPLMNGVCIAVAAFSNGVLLFTILPLARLARIDTKVISAISIVIMCFGFILLTFARSTPAIWLATTSFYVAELILTAYYGLVSTLVSPDEQGSAMALLDIMGTVAHLFAGISFDNLYPATLNIMGGAISFFALSGIEFIQLCLFLCAIFLLKNHNA